MKKGMRERVGGDGVFNCSLGELLNNKKPFRPLYIFKHVLICILVLIVNSKYTLMETSACGYSPLITVNVCLDLEYT